MGGRRVPADPLRTDITIFGLATACAISAGSRGSLMDTGHDQRNGDAPETLISVRDCARTAVFVGRCAHSRLILRKCARRPRRSAKARYRAIPLTPGSHWLAAISSCGKAAQSPANSIPEAIEPYAAELVSANRGIVLGKEKRSRQHRPQVQGTRDLDRGRSACGGACGSQEARNCQARSGGRSGISQDRCAIGNKS